MYWLQDKFYIYRQYTTIVYLTHHVLKDNWQGQISFSYNGPPTPCISNWYVFFTYMERKLAHLVTWKNHVSNNNQS
jgi:hypothetical protein